MNQVRMIIVLLSTVLATSAFAKDRYIVVYKSQQGFAAMNSFMNLESARGWGLQKSLPYIQAMVFKNSHMDVMEKLKNHPEVLTVEKEVFYKIPRPARGAKIQKDSNQNLRGGFMGGTVSSFVSTEATPWGIVAVNAPTAWSISADAGSRARVLILDTGFDKTHTAFGANFEKGRNFTGDDLSVIDENITDNVGHGTHTAGTATAAYNSSTGFVGVAPQAKLLVGKVCEEVVCTDPLDENTCTGGCGSVGIAMGINWGIQEKVDVVSMSLGGGSATIGEQAAVRAAENAGVFVVAASGNEAEILGDGSIYTPGVSYPAALPTVFAVGALDEANGKAIFSNWGPELDISAPGVGVISAVPMGSGRESSIDLMIAGQKIHLKSSIVEGAADILQPAVGDLVYATYGRVADFASLDVKGKFVLISRGEITFLEKAQNAMRAGAIGAVFFNNVDGLLMATLGEGVTLNFPLAMIDKADGAHIQAQLTNGVVISTEVKTLMTDFTSWDGTSMATPHVAGIAALVISAYKTSHAGKSITPSALRALLKKTAKPLTPNVNNEFGAGLVQADAAVNAAMTLP